MILLKVKELESQVTKLEEELALKEKHFELTEKELKKVIFLTHQYRNCECR